MFHKIGSAVGDRYVQSTCGWIKRVGSPGSTAADRHIGCVLPGGDSRCGHPPLWATGRVAWCLGYQIGFPDDATAIRRKGIHPPFHSFQISKGITNKNKSVPGDRCRAYYLACLGVSDCCCPQALAGFEVIRQYTAVQGATEQTAVQVRSATVDQYWRVGFVVLMRTPVLPAVGRIDRENVLRGGPDQSTVDHDGATVEILMQMGVVAAQYFQSANGLRIDLAQRRV